MLKSLVKKIIQICRTRYKLISTASYETEGKLSNHFFEQVPVVVETEIMVEILVETPVVVETETMVETLVETEIMVETLAETEIMVETGTVEITAEIAKSTANKVHAQLAMEGEP